LALNLKARYAKSRPKIINVSVAPIIMLVPSICITVFHTSVNPRI